MRKMIFVVMLISLMPIKAFCVASCPSGTTENVDCWDCGAKCTAVLDKNGQMTISGEGAMYQYSWTGSSPNRVTTAPWKTKIDDIERLVIEDGIETVGYSAFCGTKIKELELPASVAEIENYAFMDGALENVNTLKNLSSIGSGAFYQTNLKKADLPDNLAVINTDVFTRTDLVTIDIPDTVTSIGNYTFNGCGKLTDLIIPDSVTSIGVKAFAYDENLINLTIPNAVEKIKTSAFSGVNVANLNISADKLEMYLNAGGAFREGAGIVCTSGDCSKVLADFDKKNGTNYRYYASICKTTKPCGKAKPIRQSIRIYTIDEANAVAGKTNHVKIRYR